MCIIPHPQPTSFVVAADTEFEGPHTLMVQTAVRLDDRTLAVQLYRSAGVPELPDGFDPADFLPVTPEKYGRFFDQVLLRPVKVLTPDLSPARMLRDLGCVAATEVYPRSAGLDLEALVERKDAWTLAFPLNLTPGKRSGDWQVPPIRLTLVSHFLRADLPACSAASSSTSFAPVTTVTIPLSSYASANYCNSWSKRGGASTPSLSWNTSASVTTFSGSTSKRATPCCPTGRPVWKACAAPSSVWASPRC